MAERLNVDPRGLQQAGEALQGLVLPQPPTPLVAAGTDPVSAAVNQTMPEIESPVVEGLPAVNEALRRTGSNIIDAAATYASTDQRLGDVVRRVALADAPKQTPKKREP
ncbi:MAG: hypothetical protein WCI78_14980 [Mycobacterium sp.]